MNNTKTNTLLLTVIGVATLLVAVIGATFAYFTAQISGNESSTTLTVGAGTLGIAYSGGSALTATDIIPQTAGVASITKTFTVTGNNTTAAVMPYQIGIVVQSNTFTDNALTYTLTSTNTGGNGSVVPAISTATGIATGASTITLGSGYFSGSVTDCVHTYELDIYFTDTGVNQDTDKDKVFTAYVSTTVQTIYTTN